MSVSKKERARAHRQSRVTAAFERKSIEAASRLGFRMMSQSLSAYKANRLLDIPKILTKEYEKARVVLVEMMTLGYLTGLARLREGKGKVITAALHREALRNLYTRLQIDQKKLAEITGKMNVQATKVINRSSDALEKSLQRAIIKGVEEDLTTREGTKLIRETFAKNGVLPKSSFEYEAIFRTQTQMAYGAGTWDAAHDPAVNEILWGYKYVTVGDDRVRAEHAALDGTTASKENQIWETIWPPNGWGCRCQVIFLFDPEEPSLPEPIEIDGTTVAPVPDPGFGDNFGKSINPGNNSVRDSKAIGDGLTKKKSVRKPKATPKAVSKPEISKSDLDKILNTERNLIKRKAIEHGSVIDSKTGEILIRKQGTVDTIKFTKAEVKAQKGMISVHNHPKGGVFSTADIQFFAENGLLEEQVITSKYIYKMSRLKGQKVASSTKINKVYGSKLKELAPKMVKRFRGTGVGVTEASEILGHNAWRAVAKELGMKYLRVKI